MEGGAGAWWLDVSCGVVAMILGQPALVLPQGVLPPVFRLGDLLDDRVAFDQKSAHVAAQDEAFGKPAQRAERRGDAEVVAHFGARFAVGVGVERAEMVIVLHGMERPAQHRVLKVIGPVERGDGAGQMLADAKVTGAPCDLLAGADESGARACGGLLAGVRVAEQMDFDGARQIEAARDGSVDDRDFVQCNHAVNFQGQCLFQCGTVAGFCIRHSRFNLKAGECECKL